jgi:ubiquinone/menaquinone biosynthesis C-methylase UbiE
MKPDHRHDQRGGALSEWVMVVSMLVGRGAAARMVASLAQVGHGDQVIDVGCGPGAAVREAAKRGAEAVGIDPNVAMLQLGRWITSLLRVRGARFVEGSAESLPVPDASATVVWALSAVHHWRAPSVGLAEAWRVLRPGGRLFLVERSLVAGARLHTGHGLTAAQMADLANEVSAVGFKEVGMQVQRARRKRLAVVTAVRTGGR